MRRVAAFVVCAGVAMSFVVRGQDAGPKSLSGQLTVTSSPSGSATAVIGRAQAGAPVDFAFCISHAKPLAAPLQYSGPGKVVYLPQPIPGLPPGVEIQGPESIAPVLGVVPEKGAGHLFVAKGARPLVDPSLKDAARYTVSSVTRTDWAPKGGARRGTDAEGCIAAAG